MGGERAGLVGGRSGGAVRGVDEVGEGCRSSAP